MRNKKACLSARQGFTLIELLVVIAIIGLLSTLAVVSLNNARAKSRDAKRVADIKQMQTALELCFNDGNKYPTLVAPGGPLPVAGACGTNTLSTYIAVAPADPSTGTAYPYTSAAGATYTITFTLEGATGNLPAGAHTATPAGIQ
ncbi:MAG: prepilin-type N-terminal cleavage/methylation domain-containing protein [bacterium]|nr:prepilin-type N-terminal cleavage/methylation domain-containing protein [bacterium]